MTIKSSKKYGIILIGALFLLILGALALSDSSQNSVKPANDTDEPINIPISASIQKYTYADLNNRSDTIVIGTVKEILPSKWNTVNGKQPNKARNELILENIIYTDIIISVDEYLKNPLSSKEVRVRVTGGTVGNCTISTDYEPSFNTSEKVLLYLIEDTDPQIKDIGPEHFTITGYMQGKFTLTGDGQAIGDKETISQEKLLSTIKNSNKVEQSNYPEATSVDEPSNIGVEESITGSMSASLAALNHTELNDLSDTIVIGTVKEILPSKWNTADGKRPANTDEAFSPSCLIYTDVVISIDEYLKNPLPSKKVTVRLWGGTVGNDTLTVEDEPTFETGEKVLLYLMKDSSPSTKDIDPEHFRVTGLLQGKYTLNDDGKATRPDENTTLDDLLSTIEE